MYINRKLLRNFRGLSNHRRYCVWIALLCAVTVYVYQYGGLMVPRFGFLLNSVPKSDKSQVPIVPRPGAAEYSQYRRYLANATILQTQQAVDMDGHTLSVVSIDVDCNVARIRLKDSRSAQLSSLPQGGNSFRTISRGHRHRQFCAYIDHLNDTYDVICALYDHAINVTVHLTYVNYGAFRMDGVIVNHLLWSGTIRVANTTGCQPLPQSTYTGWFMNYPNVTQPWSWVTNGSQEWSDDQMRDCLLNKLNQPLEFIGDSHLRYSIYHMIWLNDTIPPELFGFKLRTHFEHRNYLFTFVGLLTRLTDIPGFLDDKYSVVPHARPIPGIAPYFKTTPLMVALSSWITREKCRTKLNRTLVLSVGTWDVSSYHSRYLQSLFLDKVEQALNLIRSDSSLNHVKIIVATMPAGPENKNLDVANPGAHIHLCNSALLAAINYKLTNLVHRYRHTTVVDWFAMTLTRTLHPPDGCHYLLPGPKKRMHGEVGIAMVKVLVQAMCEA